MKHKIAKAIVTTFAAAVIVASPVYGAQPDESERDKSVAVGMGTGVVVGSLIAGPVGAAVAGIVGAMMGNDVAQSKELAATTRALAERDDALAASQQQLIAMRNAYQSLDQDAKITKVNYSEGNADVMALQSSIQFQTGSVAIDASYEPQLELIGKAMRAHPDLELRLTGHADNRGDDKYNQALSMQRALNVKNELIRRGVNPERVLTVAVGEQESQSQSLETAFFDRKVVLHITNSESPLTAKQ